MSKIEGITPRKKHKTIEEKRGKYKTHQDIHATHQTQKQTVAIVVGISLVALVVGWIALARSGVIFSTTQSDSNFITSITDGFQDVDVIRVDTVNTQKEEELLDEYDKRLFPEFQE